MSHRNEAALRRHLGRMLSKGTDMRLVLDELHLRIPTGDVRFALFGGFLRDQMTGQPSRDLDLVAEGLNLGGLEYALAGQIVRRTSFGGLKAQIAGIAVDIWPLQDTWAFRSHFRGVPTFESLVQTTFLNTEAIAAVLPRAWPAEPRLIDGGFFAAFEDRILELNFEPNPAPSLSVARAIRMADALRFKMGPRLQGYLRHWIRRLNASEFDLAQSKHFGRTYLTYRDALDFLASSNLRFEEPQDASRAIVDTRPKIPFNIDMDFGEGQWRRLEKSEP